jgi:hypothetical protein
MSLVATLSDVALLTSAIDIRPTSQLDLNQTFVEPSSDFHPTFVGLLSDVSPTFIRRPFEFRSMVVSCCSTFVAVLSNGKFVLSDNSSILSNGSSTPFDVHHHFTRRLSPFYSTSGTILLNVHHRSTYVHS